MHDFTNRSAIKQINSKPLSRRQLLKQLSAITATLVLAACDNETAIPTPTNQPLSPLPTFTPTAQRSYFPWVQRSGNEASTLESPLATPIPSATPTPGEPTATPPTPTPIATPFPPGPPSKLGLFVARHDEQMFELLTTQAVTVIKTLELDSNFLGRIKSISPRTLTICRIFTPQPDLTSFDPMSAARAFVEQLLPFADDPGRRPHIDGWEAYNEPVANNVDELKRLADFEAERTRLLGERGIKSVVGNFATGTPDLDKWQHFLPAIQSAKEHQGWLGLHEYSAPTLYFLSTRDNQGRYPGISPQDSGWLTLRYRKVYNEILKPAGLAIPLIFTELGIDGQVENGRPGPSPAFGWMDFQQYWAENGYGDWGPGAYIEQLVWFDEAMRHDDFVVGGCIFALAASSGWQSFDIHGAAATVLQQYLRVHAP